MTLLLLGAVGMGEMFTFKRRLPERVESQRVIDAIQAYIVESRIARGPYDANSRLREDFSIGTLLGIGLDDAILEILDALDIPERLHGDDRLAEREMNSLGDLAEYLLDVLLLAEQRSR